MAHYQLDIKTHLPKDPPWREENVNLRRVVTAEAPQSLVTGAIDMLLRLVALDKNPNVMIGILLDIVNQWPEAARLAMAVGTIHGLGLTLMEDDEGEIIGSLDPIYEKLSPPTVEEQESQQIFVPNAEQTAEILRRSDEEGRRG